MSFIVDDFIYFYCRWLNPIQQKNCFRKCVQSQFFQRIKQKLRYKHDNISKRMKENKWSATCASLFCSFTHTDVYNTEQTETNHAFVGMFLIKMNVWIEAMLTHWMRQNSMPIGTIQMRTQLNLRQKIKPQLWPPWLPEMASHSNFEFNRMSFGNRMLHFCDAAKPQRIITVPRTSYIYSQNADWGHD